MNLLAELTNGQVDEIIRLVSVLFSIITTITTALLLHFQRKNKNENQTAIAAVNAEVVKNTEKTEEAAAKADIAYATANGHNEKIVEAMVVAQEAKEIVKDAKAVVEEVKAVVTSP